MDFYQIDAFTNKLFRGNPAGLCPLDSWISESLMQKIANENNLSETAFFVKEENRYIIRWFTPEEEIDLCGHATLAAAHLILNVLGLEESTVNFYSHLSGTLTVTKTGSQLTMEFPSRPGKPIKNVPMLTKVLGVEPKEIYLSRDHMVILESEEQVINLKPDMELLKKLDAFGIVVTAPGREQDFISRYFAPNCGVQEDPVTGSSHCTLIPYWSKKLNKKILTAYQASPRGGYLSCRDLDDRVSISGEAVLYLKGELFIKGR